MHYKLCTTSQLIDWICQHAFLRPEFDLTLVDRIAEIQKNKGQVSTGEREYLEYLIEKHGICTVSMRGLSAIERLKVMLFKEYLNHDPEKLALDDRYLFFKLQEHEIIRETTNEENE